jgi:hypothetical protein
MKDRDELQVAHNVTLRMLDDLQAENQRLIRWLRSIADVTHDSDAARKAYRALSGEPFPSSSPWHPAQVPYDRDDAS